MNIDIDIRHLLTILLWLSILYLVARVLIFIIEDWVSKSNIKWQKGYITKAKILLTPAMFILAISGLLISYPIIALIVTVVLYLLFKDFIKNYFLGIYFKLNDKLTVNSNINSGGVSGGLSEFTRMGMWINTDIGLKFVSYKSLYKNGFILNDSNHISTLYTIKAKGSTSKELYELEGLLITSPYLDSDKKITIEIDEGIITARVNLRNPKHYIELKEYLQENNFTLIKE